MIIEFSALGLSFNARCRCHYSGFRGLLEEPPEPHNIEILSLEVAPSGEDATFLLESNVCDQLFEAAYDQLEQTLIDEMADAAEARFEQRREEEFMCRSY